MRVSMLPRKSAKLNPVGSNGILTVSAIGIAVRLSLRTRLTLIPQIADAAQNKKEAA